MVGDTGRGDRQQQLKCGPQVDIYSRCRWQVLPPAACSWLTLLQLILVAGAPGHPQYRVVVPPHFSNKTGRPLRWWCAPGRCRTAVRPWQPGGGGWGGLGWPKRFASRSWDPASLSSPMAPRVGKPAASEAASSETPERSRSGAWGVHRELIVRQMSSSENSCGELRVEMDEGSAGFSKLGRAHSLELNLWFSQ